MVDASRINLEKINSMINDMENYELKPLSSLALHKPFTIKKLRVVKPKFGETILAILSDNTDNTIFKCFLPQRLLKILNEDVISSINLSENQYFKMSRQHRAESWSEAEELNLAVDTLSCVLNLRAYKSAKLADSDPDCALYHTNNMEKYTTGINLCQRFLYRMLNLEEFCSAMLDADLKDSMLDIAHYLPENIVNALKLNETSDYDTDDETADEGPKESILEEAN